MSRIDTIKTELDTDPLTRGYAGMTDEQAADDMNTVYRQRNRTHMDANRILSAVDLAELTAMTDASKQRAFWGMMSMAGYHGLDPFDPAVVEIFTVVFGGGSQTLTNLQAARIKNVSRAEELGLSEVKAGEVSRARSIP